MTTPSLYYWIRIPSTPESCEDDQYRLIDSGALGAEEMEGIEGSTLWIRGFFDDPAILAIAREIFSDRQDVEWGENEWEDWDRSWRERQIPVEVTQALSVCPPWVAAPDGVAHVIRLEAKMAFGTGSHESTRIAALLLEKMELREKSVLDVGTGTGILSLYPAQLGARFVVGFDIDPVTGPCLKENLDLNPLRLTSTSTSTPKSKVVFYVGTLDSLRDEACFDIIICNMIRTEAWPYLDAFLDRLNPNGRLILSGQRVEDQPHWNKWFAEKNIRPVDEITLGEWWGFVV